MSNVTEIKMWDLLRGLLTSVISGEGLATDTKNAPRNTQIKGVGCTFLSRVERPGRSTIQLSYKLLRIQAV